MRQIRLMMSAASFRLPSEVLGSQFESKILLTHQSPMLSPPASADALNELEKSAIFWMKYRKKKMQRSRSNTNVPRVVTTAISVETIPLPLENATLAMSLLFS